MINKLLNLVNKYIYQHIITHYIQNFKHLKMMINNVQKL